MALSLDFALTFMILPSLLRARRSGISGPLILFVATAFCSALAQLPPDNRKALESYALQHDGDAAKGRVLFADLTRVTCTQCHTVDGGSGKAGPDLAGIGDKFPRPDLIKSVL